MGMAGGEGEHQRSGPNVPVQGVLQRSQTERLLASPLPSRVQSQSRFSLSSSSLLQGERGGGGGGGESMYDSSDLVEQIAPCWAAVDAGDGSCAGGGGIDHACQNADYEKTRGAWRRAVVPQIEYERT